MKNVASWSETQVSRWLFEEGLQEYQEDLGHLNGKKLLQLNQQELQKLMPTPLASGKNRQLLERIETLKIENHIALHKNGHPVDIQHLRSNGRPNGGPNGLHQEVVWIPSSPPERSPFPLEWSKTAVAFFYALCCFSFTSVTISVVHERVPAIEISPPLPDKFFDIFDRVEWAFSICEINGMLLVSIWFLQWISLKHRSIVCRRFFFIVGTLYLYRCITMYVTTLPVPGMHFKCSPKISNNWVLQMHRFLKMMAGGGLSITGAHNLCGDYLYSGHTVMLTLTYLFIKEYSPKRLWLYHWFCWSLSVVGVFCILLAHDHYTVDVVVAYYVTSRLFWWYHTMADHPILKEPSQNNSLSQVWWFRFFHYFEKNVQGVVPRSYELPFYCWASAQTLQRYSRGDP